VPADLLIYIAIAAVLIIWLRNTLGTRTGEERDRSEEVKHLEERMRAHAEGKPDPDEILDLSKPSTTADANIKKLQIADTDTAQKLAELIHNAPDFDPVFFINGAKEAFAMIVEAFAHGDAKTLKNLLSPGVYRAFEEEIFARQDRGETIQTDIHLVKEAEITNISFIDRMVFIKIRFCAEETCVIRDREGTILSGNPDKITTMKDVWTFGKELKSKDPTWYLYETADDEVEDHKTPIPDAQ